MRRGDGALGEEREQKMGERKELSHRAKTGEGSEDRVGVASSSKAAKLL